MKHQFDSKLSQCYHHNQEQNIFWNQKNIQIQYLILKYIIKVTKSQKVFPIGSYLCLGAYAVNIWSTKAHKAAKLIGHIANKTSHCHKPLPPTKLVRIKSISVPASMFDIISTTKFSLLDCAMITFYRPILLDYDECN